MKDTTNTMNPTFALLTVLLLVPLATLHAADNAAPSPSDESSTQAAVQVTAYYFPNFGPIQTSEWGLIKWAKPQFEGHLQPKVPA